MKDFLWLIGGEAGYGIMTTGLAFAKIAARSGYHTFDYIEYPSLIRGGHNAFEILVSEQEVHALQHVIDVMVCLNQDTFKYHSFRLAKDSVVIYDHEEFEPTGNYELLGVPFKKILKKHKGEAIMKNTIGMGASLALLSGDINILFEMLEEQFSKKGREIVEFNKIFAQEGYDHVIKNYPNLIKKALVKKEAPDKMIMSGNDAFAYGAVAADSRLYVAYPMTPSSTVLGTLAAWQQKTGIVVRHAEDEISVINTALGATFMGVRAAVGTSGGGFALMVESLSFAGVAEMPIVVFLSQRPGPATGMPTWTEQGDLLFAVNAGHGEFPKIVIAPGDVDEMLELTVKGFNLADIYQTPVIVMSDMWLSESHKSIDVEKAKNLTSLPIDRGKTVAVPKGEVYLRYELSSDGISPRLIPGAPNVFYQANSYEHDQDSHTTELAKPRREQVEKRNQKTATYLAKHFQMPRTYGNMKTAKKVFVTWGATKGAILEVLEDLKGAGEEYGFIHFTHVFPLDGAKVAALFAPDKEYILVENNSQGQFGKLLRAETGVNIERKLLKYDGRPIYKEDIYEFVKKI